MTNYFANLIIGIFLGFLLGNFYLLVIDKIFFNNYVSNMNDYDQSFHGALLPVFIGLVFLFIKEFKKGNIDQYKEIQTIILVIGCLMGAYFFNAIINLAFNFMFIIIFGEKLAENIGGFTLGSMAGFVMVSYFYTKIKRES
jgi:hypothetical protein|tara:strand:- start:68 stop:490 length:423 start_codon:yes stop_codon:yes gene_type:complete